METSSTTSIAECFGTLFLYRFFKELDKEWAHEKPIYTDRLDKAQRDAERVCFITQKTWVSNKVMEELKKGSIKISDIPSQVERYSTQLGSSSFRISELVAGLFHKISENFQLAEACNSLKDSAEVTSRIQALCPKDQVDVCWFLTLLNPDKGEQYTSLHFSRYTFKEIQTIQEPFSIRPLCSSLKTRQKAGSMSFASQEKLCRIRLISE